MNRPPEDLLQKSPKFESFKSSVTGPDHALLFVIICLIIRVSFVIG